MDVAEVRSLAEHCPVWMVCGRVTEAHCDEVTAHVSETQSSDSWVPDPQTDPLCLALALPFKVPAPRGLSVLEGMAELTAGWDGTV